MTVKRRRLTEEDVADFLNSEPKPPKGFTPLTFGALRLSLVAKNWVRMRRLDKDFAWMQKQLKKMNVDPEAARWLL